MKNTLSQKIIISVILIFLVTSCGKKEVPTDFVDICQNGDQTKVSIKGFIKNSPSNTGKVSNKFLLVENQNGTGGFIEIKLSGDENFSKNSPVQIIGELKKKENSCVLNIIEIKK